MTLDLRTNAINPTAPPRRATVALTIHCYPGVRTGIHCDERGPVENQTILVVFLRA